MAKFTLTNDHTALLAAIAAGTTTHVAKSAEAEALAKEGFIEVNPEMLDGNGNAAVRLTEKGKANAPTNGPGNTPVGNAPTVSFAIMANVAPPAIKRGGGGGTRETKYPLKDIPLGGGIFIAAEEGREAKKMSKQFGSMVAEFNKNNTDKYLTSRTIEDGGEAGFGEQFKGKAGIGIFHRPLSEKKAKKTAAAA